MDRSQLEKLYRSAAVTPPPTLEQKRLNRTFNKPSVAPPTPKPTLKPNFFAQKISIPTKIPPIPTPKITEIGQAATRTLTKLGGVGQVLGSAFAAWQVYAQGVKTIQGFQDLYGAWRDYFAYSAKDSDYLPETYQFTGGQRAVRYNFYVWFKSTNGTIYNCVENNDPYGVAFNPTSPFAHRGEIWGPISQFRLVTPATFPGSCPGGFVAMEIFCHGRSEVASRSSQPYWYYWDAGFNNTAGSFTRIHSIAVVPKDGQPDPGLPPPITAPVNNPNFKPISPTPESPPEKKLGTSIAPSINPTISPSPTPEAVISSNPGATVAPPIAPPPEPYNPQAPDDPPTTDDPKNQNKLPFSGTPLLIPPFAALAPPSNKSTPIKNGAGTGAANAPSSEDTTTYQTPVDECRGSCADKAKGGGLSPESISNLGNTLNDLLLQNPLLLKIDNTTTTAKSFLQTAWQTTRIDKILNYLSLLATLHNAAMLSRNLGASLGDVFSSIANNTISFIKNEESNDIDINATLGNTIENFLKGLLGEENYNNTSETFSRYNRIINAASNIIYSIQSVQAGLTEGLETVGSYTGKIGNALKKSGAVLAP